MPPTPPSVPPPVAPDGWRAAAVALLNLSGLGLGYALTRRWVAMAACWVATAVFLLAALPADPDGIPGAALVAYAVVLVLAALHGAFVGLRRPLLWPGRPHLAVLLGLLLLGVPAGGGVLYDGARDEATEQMLLDRLDGADRLVETAGKQPFKTAESDFRRALGVYSDLRRNHPGSRAADRVPERMTTYYKTVGAAYEQKKYCDAIEPLRYLRTVPDDMPKEDLGTLATWPDERLATSLYECGSVGLGTGDAGWPAVYGELLKTFPRSEQAADVGPAVKSAVDKAAKDVRGDDPCAAVEHLKSLGSQIGSVTGGDADTARSLDADAGRAGKAADSGAYACGVDHYKDGDFDEALTTMNEFVAKNKHDKHRSLAKKIAIAAEIAKTVPAAGKRLPTTASGGSISVTIKNDSPDAVTVLYTGPVTGSLTLKACGSCTTYPFGTTLNSVFRPCKSGKHYPQKTITLPAGTTYFLHKPQGDSTASLASDTAKLRPGYIYTECAYSTQGFGLGN